MKLHEGMTLFWGRSDAFSNWHPAKFTVKGVDFNCNEQFMMYCKAKLFGDDGVAERIMLCDKPEGHKALGRLVSGFDQMIWNQNAEKIVYWGCYAKFSQNLDLLQALLATGNTELVEASPYDKIWGVGLSEDDPLIANKSAWPGKNLLGIVLMRVRTDLSNGLNPAFIWREAHAIDNDFMLMIKSRYRVSITDQENAPWKVKFEGPRAGLMNMLNDHWYQSSEEVVTLNDAQIREV